MAEATPEKVKTKAKMRYLKAKKERKKLRKTAVPTAPTSTAIPPRTEDDVWESDESIQEQVKEPSKGITRAEKRPKKKLKIVTATEEELEPSGDWMDLDEPQPLSEEPPMPLPAPESNSTAALPTFSRPVHPQPASKIDLDLQGLDQALLDAEMVDSSHTLPLSDAPSPQHGLSQKTCKRLKDLGITELFAVQTALLPFLLADSPELYQPYNPPRDVCVSAPTGSGKTLAYVLPIIETLSSRIVTRLRALVVLPTRDLVAQVNETFESLSKGTGLKIGVATGQHSFPHEQAAIVGEHNQILLGGKSKVDILICTPGRLIDHLNGTPNFSLQHLRFLVIDEADRLLTQSFQDWLSEVFNALRPPQESIHPTDLQSLIYPDSLAPHWLSVALSGQETDFDEKQESSCQKLLFSATLTRDPGKIASLGLRDPKYFIVKESAIDSGLHSEHFSLPVTLKEHMVVCETSNKPLILFHLVHNHAVNDALIFTKSAESTARLVTLFEFLEKEWAASEPGRTAIVARAYSSDLSQSQRKAVLEQFKKREIGILICSDLISRGIDINHVSHVVSYDAPVDMRKYVHRVGRTARAGRDGDAWSLIEEQEARHFKSMLSTVGHLQKVKRLRINAVDLALYQTHYEVALNHLRKVYGKENN